MLKVNKRDIEVTMAVQPYLHFFSVRAMEMKNGKSLFCACLDCLTFSVVQHHLSVFVEHFYVIRFHMS